MTLRVRTAPAAVLAYVLCCVVLFLLMDHEVVWPINWWLAGAAFITANIAVGYLTASGLAPALGLLVGVAMVLVGLKEHAVAFAAFGSLFLMAPAVVLIAIGVVIAKARARLTRDRPAGHAGTVVGFGAMAFAAVPLALAVVGGEVRATHLHPIAIDERTGALAGVPLGSTRHDIELAFGPHPRACGWCEGATTPNPVGRHRAYSMHYPGLTFRLRDGRLVDTIIETQRAQTRKGLGVGDSISLISDAYPQLHCADIFLGSDSDYPAGYCTGKTGPHTWMYFAADRIVHGAPVYSIEIANHPIQP